MSTGDFVAGAGFIALVGFGVLASSFFAESGSAATKRIRERVRHTARQDAASRGAKRVAGNVALVSLERDEGAIRAWILRRIARICAVAGPKGMYFVLASASAGALAAAVGVHAIGPPEWTTPFIYIAAPLLSLRLSYRFLIARFRARFLAVFPETIDLIVRAVRAGIPVVQAIRTAGSDAREPVRSAFRAMGDRLMVGADLKDVLNQSAERLQIADFSFFAAYVLLQRETGGSLGETLEDLSEIIRARRDIRIRTRALTAESRIVTKTIAAVPFAICGFLSFVNRSYIALLFVTEQGHKILTLAVVLLLIGLAIIHRQSKLETSR
jgi:Flp pilus assembly protein TadB